MDSSDVKWRITHLEGLPSLPPLVASAICTPPHQPEAAEAVTILFDQHLFLRVLLAQASDSGYSPFELTDEKLAHALGFFGHRKARNWLLLALLPPLFPVPESGGLPRETFWKHALLCAHCSEIVCEHLGSISAPDAFPAGLLHDIGKLALDVVAPEDYARALDMAHREGLFIRQAERAVFGMDHALAGKWLVERWGLPRLLSDAVWLHDQPEAAPRTTLGHRHLADAVALGNAMARRLLRGSSGDSKQLPITRERLERLGLNQAELDVIRAETIAAAEHLLKGFQRAHDAFERLQAREDHASTPAENVTVGVRTLRENHRMRREVQRYRILHELNMSLTTDLSPEAIIDVFVESLQRELRVTTGLCLTFDAAKENLWGKRWEEMGAAQTVQLPAPRGLLGLAPEAAQAPGENILKALATTNTPNNEALRTMLQDQTMCPIPMVHQGQCLGYLVVPAKGAQGLLTDEKYGELTAFAAACALALHRAHEMSLQREHAEELARSLAQSREHTGCDERARRLESIRRIAAGIAHEVNNPLAVISGHAQLLEKRFDAPDVRRSLKAIEDHSQRASQVLRELLKVAQPEFPTKEPVMLPFLLHQLVGMVCERLEEKHIAIVEDYEDGLPRVHLDQHQMSQAILNLIANAEDAMADGGGTLTLSAHPCTGNRTVAIAIADTGRGIPEDQIDHVFEPFYSVRPNSDNLGLGLPVCLRIAENHGGTLDLESKEGEGTRATLTLPIGPETAPSDQENAGEGLQAVPHLRRLPSRWWESTKY